MSDSNKLIDVIKKEVKVCFDMIELAINNMDDNEWGETKNEWSYATNLYHIIETMEFYLYDNENGMNNAGELGIKTEDLSKEEIPTQINQLKKPFFVKYLERVKDLLFTKLETFTDSDLYDTDDFSKWGFTTRYYKYSYVIRHTMFHTGELNLLLRNSGRSRIKWL